MANNRYFLGTTKDLTILIDEEVVLAGKYDMLVSIGELVYETTSFKCISKEQGVRKLHENFRKQFFEVKDSMVKKINELKTNLENQKVKIKEVEVIKEVPAPAPAGAGNSGLGGRLEELMLQVLASETVKNMESIIKPELDKFIAEKYGVLPKVIEVKVPNKEPKEFNETVHSEFETVLNLVTADIPVFLTGPAGSGKNHLCKKVAEALGMDFYFTNAVTSEYKITGFIDANGNYHETEFYKAFKNGGLFMLDEMDASIPEVLIILNAAIANRYFDFPNGKIEAHENFRVISAGNTVGTGADNEYTGRLQLDASSLDRFALIEINYDYDIELSIAKGNVELVEFIRDFRSALNESGIQHLVSYRSIERITKLENVMDIEKVLNMCLIKNLSIDDLNIVIGSMKGTQNKYYKAINRVKSNIKKVV